MKVEKEKKYRSHCPTNLALEVFGDKWTFLIIRDIMIDRKHHFREFLRSEEKIASNILTDRLNMLESEGIISKKSDPSHKQKNIYSLTEKGIDLFPILIEMAAWSTKYKPVDEEKAIRAKYFINGGKDVQRKYMEELKKNM